MSSISKLFFALVSAAALAVTPTAAFAGPGRGADDTVREVRGGRGLDDVVPEIR